MPGAGLEIYPDEYYTKEKLEELGSLKITEALKVGKLDHKRFERLMREAGVERSYVYNPKERRKRDRPTDKLTDEFLRELDHCSYYEIGKQTGFAASTISKLYQERAIKHYQTDDANEVYLRGTRKPVKGHHKGCGKCKHRKSCKEFYKQGLPLLCEGITEDDDPAYIQLARKEYAKAC
jgi:hypothetical protein